MSDSPRSLPAGWLAVSVFSSRGLKVGIFAFVSLSLVCFAAFYNPTVFRRPVSPSSYSPWNINSTQLAGENENLTQNHTPAAFSKTSLTKPSNLKIVAVIFYGRPDRVEILDCYLKRNLAVNGGWVDEVYWAPNTKSQDDLDWLDKLVPTSSQYKKLPIDTQKEGYARIWDNAITEPDTLYIKIDDDIVYIDDNAIPKMVSLKLEQDHSFVVSANVVNGAPLSYHHFRTGAIRPYLPEMIKPNSTDDGNVTSVQTPPWRASQLPSWEGPSDFEFPLGVGTSPYPNHRWLPLRDGNRSSIYRTPIQHAPCSPWGETYGKWSLAAQQHFSFFESLEKNETDVYDFARSGIWDMGFERISINFIAIWGRDVIDHLPLNDDEAMLTKSIPRQLSRPVLVATGALASHYSFTSQVNDLRETDILSRYRAYANELICPGTLF
ncbi:hypothetical protein AJ79_06806 [Helicocarpus griseus UAMH5409]|uniref:Uncharacterized protein n=1 Tax=Helicocarpus griseus UAMH5409 TaxID=1447875 RepID=A0A2B7X9B9_9EURO|nr:hypothetical protein AJ79_06806 [Helicocarpus griseus UAMH5409]